MKICVIMVLAFLITTAGAVPIEVISTLSVPVLNPGDRNIELRFVVQNIQDTMLSNIRVYLFLAPPFSASLPSNTKTGEIIDPGYLIGIGQMQNEYTPSFELSPGQSRRTLFKIDIDRNATYGSYDIPYTIFYDYLGNKQYNGKITLKVGGNTLIDITCAALENSTKIQPGDVFKVRIALENTGDNELKWLKLSLSPKDRMLVSLSSDAEAVFKNIVQGEKKEAEFQFSLEKDAPARNYPIDIMLSYMDERGMLYNETKLFGIASAGKSALDIAKKTTEPASIKQAQDFILTLKIENTGTGDAKGVSARLESALEGDTLAYLGEIKRDDYSNAVFTLSAKNSGKETATLFLTYEDDFGRHEIQKEIILIVHPAEDHGQFPLLIGIIAVAVVLALWKRRKS